MKTLVVYDSKFGNTEKVARIIAKAIDAQVFYVRQVAPWLIKSADLMIVGSPTQGGRPTQLLQDFLSRLPNDALLGCRVAAFDTRFAIQDHGTGLRVLMRVIGFAAGKLMKGLEAKGGSKVVEPEGFIVESTQGPLGPGEQDRAGRWAQAVLAAARRTR
jgi:flavodoxin I